MGRSARQRAVEHFAEERIVQRYEALYEDVLSGD